MPDETNPTTATEAPEPAPAPLPVEPADSAVQRLEQERDELRDRHLRLAAEFDNYRKRVTKERQETADRAQGALLTQLLDALDDLDRTLASDPATTSAETLRGAADALAKKLWKGLGAAGLEPLVPTGAPFNPAEHEAVASLPAPSPAQAQTVATTFQAGYRFKGQLLRPARVQVYAE